MPDAARPEASAQNDPLGIRFDSKASLALYMGKEYDKLCQQYLTILDHLENTTYLQLSQDDLLTLQEFAGNFLYVFSQPDFLIGAPYVDRFIDRNPTISNLVMMALQGNTDATLRFLLNKSYRNNLVKVLALYSPRNEVWIDPKALLNADQKAGCRWYSTWYYNYLSAISNKNGFAQYKAHVRFDDERLTEFFHLADCCFGATYMDHENDRLLKQKINRIVQRDLAVERVHITSRPKKNKVAVISDFWHPRHSVYRNQKRFVDALRGSYELTFVNLYYPDRETFDLDGFDDAIFLGTTDGRVNFDPVKDNDFQIAYFTDVGMSHQSIICSNARIAPIQITSLGHSVSTFGSKVDYYISGADVEIPDHPERNYSERLVLIPGYGVIHNPIGYQIQGKEKKQPDFIINCPWFSQKTNYEMLQVLAEIIGRAGTKLGFRFFPGSSLAIRNGYIPFIRDVEAVLGNGNFEVMRNLAYDQYMEEMEVGDICIDSYPFGGCNTIADGLYLAKPTVTWEGTRWYNRIGSQMLRSIGLGELVATNREEYVARVLRLIQDREYRDGISERIRGQDLSRTIFGADAAPYFRQAFDYIVENHDRLQAEPSRTPIRIPDLHRLAGPEI